MAEYTLTDEERVETREQAEQLSRSLTAPHVLSQIDAAIALKTRLLLDSDKDDDANRGYIKALEWVKSLPKRMIENLA